MPCSASKKKAMDANIERFKSIVEEAIASQKMTRSAGVDLTKLMCLVAEVLRDMSSRSQVSDVLKSLTENAKASPAKSMPADTDGNADVDVHSDGQLAMSEYSSSFDGIQSSIASQDAKLGKNMSVGTDKNGDADIYADALPVVVDSSSGLDKTKAHLIAICCMCQGLAVVEYPSLHLPAFTSGYGQNMAKNGLGYVTCSKCMRAIKASGGNPKSSDWSKMQKFQNGLMDTDGELRTSLKKGFKPYLGNNITVLKLKNQLAYLTAKICRRSLQDGSMIWNVELSMDGSTNPQLSLSRHQNGDFFTNISM